MRTSHWVGERRHHASHATQGSLGTGGGRDTQPGRGPPPPAAASRGSEPFSDPPRPGGGMRWTRDLGQTSRWWASCPAPTEAPTEGRVTPQAGRGPPSSWGRNGASQKVSCWPSPKVHPVPRTDGHRAAHRRGFRGCPEGSRDVGRASRAPEPLVGPLTPRGLPALLTCACDPESRFWWRQVHSSAPAGEAAPTPPLPKPHVSSATSPGVTPLLLMLTDGGAQGTRSGQGPWAEAGGRGSGQGLRPCEHCHWPTGLRSEVRHITLRPDPSSSPQGQHLDGDPAGPLDPQTLHLCPQSPQPRAYRGSALPRTLLPAGHTSAPQGLHSRALGREPPGPSHPAARAPGWGFLLAPPGAPPMGASSG